MDRKTLHYAVVLALICVVATVGVAGTYVITRARILAGEERERAASQARVVQAARFEPVNPSAPASERVLRGLDAMGEPVGYVAVGEAQGYSGKVRVMAGMDARAQRLLNVVVIAQTETPGLGTRVCDPVSDRTWWAVLTRAPTDPTADATPEFLRQFRGRAPDKLALRPALPDGVQAVSGATISSRAAANAARDAVEKIRKALGAPTADAKPAPARSADAVTGASAHAAPPPSSPGASSRP